MQWCDFPSNVAKTVLDFYILIVMFFKALSLAQCCKAKSFRSYRITYRRYADDMQLYVPLHITPYSFDNFFACLGDVKCWLSVNF